MTDNTLSMMLVRHEGENKIGANHFPYLCPAGKLTLGWGRNIEDRGISDDEAMLMLHNDIVISRRELADKFGWFDSLDRIRQMALIDMHFNMGMNKLSGFVNTMASFAARSYDEAADNAMDSEWYRQLSNDKTEYKERAEEIVHMIRTGSIQE